MYLGRRVSRVVHLPLPYCPSLVFVMTPNFTSASSRISASHHRLLAHRTPITTHSHHNVRIPAAHAVDISLTHHPGGFPSKHCCPMLSAPGYVPPRSRDAPPTFRSTTNLPAQFFGLTGAGLSKLRHMQNGGKRQRHSVDQWDRQSTF